MYNEVISMRTTQPLHTSWRFHLGEAPDASFKGYNDAAWLPVTIPHDWSVSLPFDQSYSSGSGYLAGGIGWYRRHFTLGDTQGKRVFLTFLGVYKRPKVYVNSNYAGERAYGYTSFTLEVTPFVKPGDNVVAVRCEHQDLADSRWFTGNGIYRDVLLTVTEQDCFAPDGVFIRTEEVQHGTARLSVEAEVLGQGDVCCKLLDAQGQTVSQGGHEMEVPAAHLWSPESPYLYTLVCSLIKDGEPVDEVAIPYGIRTFHFDGETGFTLNGQSMKLKGVCVHHDAGVLGAAVPPEIWRQRFKTLQKAGCNAIRFAHNPPDPRLLDECDQLGLMVMDEAFDEWEGCKNKWWQGHNVYPPKHFGYAEDWGVWHETDLTSLIRRDRNHACVILWSIGNEIDYPNDPYVHPLFTSMTGNNDANKPAAERRYNPDKPNMERLKALAEELTAIVHRHDPTRPVTAALAFPELSCELGVGDAVDVVGYNYKEHLYEEHRAKWPTHIVLGSENSHDARAWLAVRDDPRIAAQFLWTGVDFLGECPGWPWRISQAGMLDLCGYEKPRFYHRAAMWTDAPVAKLGVTVPKRAWDSQSVWQGEAGEEKLIFCFTNADRAELFLNGRSLGEQIPGDHYAARWTAPYEPGELRVVCQFADRVVEDVLQTPGHAVRLCTGATELTLPADGHTTVRVDISLLDEQGHYAAGDDRPVRCQVLGDVTFMGLENGCPFDLTPYALPTRSTWQGRGVVYLRAGTEKGEALLSLKAENLPEVRVKVRLV